MNAKRRKNLAILKDKIIDIYDILEEVKEEEEEYRDNIPENLQGSERYEKADNACNSLEYALDNLSDAKEYIESAME